jgi:hypothetical protein
MIATDVINPAMSIINASTVYGTNDDTEKYPAQFLTDMAVAASDDVCQVIVNTPGHPLLKAFITDSASMGDGAVISAASGGGTIYDCFNIKVDGVDARRKAVTYFKRLQTDPLSRTTIPKYFDLVGAGSVIRHNGTAATAKVVRFAKSAGVMQAPDEMLNAVIACFISMVHPKHGEFVQVASYYAQQWAIRQQMIREGKVTIPAVVAYQQMEEQG